MKQGLLNFIVKGLLVNIFLFNISIAAATNLTRGPYLQTGTSTSVIVRWRSDEATNSRVRLGAHPTNLNIIVDDANLTTEHIVQVTGLTPNTKYFYAIGSTTERLSGGDANTHFSTAPKTGERVPFRTWVIGDAGTGTAGQVAVYDAYRNFTGATKTNLWLQLGDNAYPDGTDADFQANVFNVYQDMLRQSVTWPAFGNHDGHSASSNSQSGPYYEMFSLPKNAEAGGVASGTEAYYSFDYANVHFIVLDSYKTDRKLGAPMYNWLQADLKAARADWIIAIWHHPPYSKGAHDSDTEGELVEMRENFLPLLETHGVDLVLAGHSHSYERSKLISGHYGDSTTFSNAYLKQSGSGQAEGDGAYNKRTTGLPHAGTVYAVAGSSGKLKPGPFNHPVMFDSVYELGSMVLDVNGLTLNAKFINDTGDVRDDFTLTKNDSSNLGRINGLVWNDADADGIREADETGLRNIEIQLFNSNNQLVAKTFSDSTGAYRFSDLIAATYIAHFVKGAYTIALKDQGNNDSTDSDTTPIDGKTSAIIVTAGSTVNNVDVGLIAPATSSTAATSSKNNSSVGFSVAPSSKLASSKPGSSTPRSSSLPSSTSRSSPASSIASSNNSGISPVSLQDGLNGYTGTSDTYVASGQPTMNYGSSESVLVDNTESTNGLSVALLKWDISSIPRGKRVTAVTLTLNVFSPSTSTYYLHGMNVGWAENAATWNNTSPVNNKGGVMGSFASKAAGVYTVALNAEGISHVQNWVNGSANNGLMILDNDGGSSITIRSSEGGMIGSRPRMVVSFE